MRRIIATCMSLVTAAAFVPPASAEGVPFTPLEECNLLTSDVVALGTIQSSVFRSNVYQVVMSVDECLKGACSDTLGFAGWPPHIGSGTRYAAGERVLMVLVYRGLGATRTLLAHSRHDKIEIGPDGAVRETNVPLDDYLSGVRELLAPRDPERLYERADLVMLAEVVALVDLTSDERAQLPPAADPPDVALRAIEVFKGEHPGQLIPASPPRMIKGECYDYVNFSFPGDEAVLVFLERPQGGMYRFAGSHDGKYRAGDPTTDWILEWLRRPPN